MEAALCNNTKFNDEFDKQWVIEQKIMEVSKYYSRITLKRLADLLCLSMQETENHLSDMVVSKALVAKIDRPLGIVSFKVTKDNSEVLNSWSMDRSVKLEKIVNLIEKSCLHIYKETMVYKIALTV